MFGYGNDNILPCASAFTGPHILNHQKIIVYLPAKHSCCNTLPAALRRYAYLQRVCLVHCLQIL